MKKCKITILSMVIVLVLVATMMTAIGCKSDKDDEQSSEAFGIWGDTDLNDLKAIEKKLTSFYIDPNFTCSMNCYSFADEDRTEPFMGRTSGICKGGAYNYGYLFIFDDNKGAQVKARNEQGEWIEEDYLDDIQEIIRDLVYPTFVFGFSANTYKIEGKKYICDEYTVTLTEDGFIYESVLEGAFEGNLVYEVYNVGSTTVDSLMKIKEDDRT